MSGPIALNPSSGLRPASLKGGTNKNGKQPADAIGLARKTKSLVTYYRVARLSHLGVTTSRDYLW